ncbi:MAG: hypothetical protein ACFCBW_18915, partial [Candidatus Competibacterales bacterium]
AAPLEAEQAERALEDLTLALVQPGANPQNPQQLVRNPFLRWQEINDRYPDQPIRFLGPSRVEDLFNKLVELVLEPQCQQLRGFRENYAGRLEEDLLCRTLRDDGRYANYDITSQGLAQRVIDDRNLIGIFDYVTFYRHRRQLRALPLLAPTVRGVGEVLPVVSGELNPDGVNPAYPNQVPIRPNRYSVSSQRYPLTIPLYLYVKADHIELVPGLQDVIVEWTSSDAIDYDGYLTRVGMAPLLRNQRIDAQYRANFVTPIDFNERLGDEFEAAP